jgi:trimethylamine-N-oxide reductase (cytochrome c)
MKLSSIKFRIFLFVAAQWLKLTSVKYPAFRKRLKEKNFTAQIKVMDNPIGRYFTFSNGKISSKSGIHPSPDVCMAFSDVALACSLLMPRLNQLKQLVLGSFFSGLNFANAMKNFRLTLEGPDELTVWFMETLSLMFYAGIDYGVDVGDNTKRYVNNSNAGALFVYVKDNKIIRMTPVEFDDSDAPSYTIEARGKKFTPPRKNTLSPFGYAMKSMVYSPDRILYPMKRVDFDPNGERCCENRGISGSSESVGMMLWISLLARLNVLKGTMVQVLF